LELRAMRIVLGLVESMFVPASMALVAHFHDSRTVGLHGASISVGNYTGLLAGGTIGGYLGEQYGWRSLFVMRFHTPHRSPSVVERDVTFSPATPAF
jgi:MFS family permease